MADSKKEAQTLDRLGALSLDFSELGQKENGNDSNGHLVPSASSDPPSEQEDHSPGVHHHEKPPRDLQVAEQPLIKKITFPQNTA